MIKSVILVEVKLDAMSNNFSRKFNFKSSFQPILVVLKCCGVDISWPDEKKSGLIQWLTHFYTLVWLVFNVGINYYARFMAAFQYDSDFTSFYLVTYNVITMIGVVGIHIFLLLINRPRFAAVMQHFGQLENRLHDRNIFIRTRRFCMYCVVIAVVSVNYTQFRLF